MRAARLNPPVSADANNADPDDIKSVLTANRIKIYPPYQGRLVTVFASDLIAGSNPPAWSRRQVGQVLMTLDTVTIQPAPITKERYFSVRVEVATDVAPGLYDDFVMQSFVLQSSTHSADFDFRYT